MSWQQWHYGTNVFRKLIWKSIYVLSLTFFQIITIPYIYKQVKQKKVSFIGVQHTYSRTNVHAHTPTLCFWYNTHPYTFLLHLSKTFSICHKKWQRWTLPLVVPSPWHCIRVENEDAILRCVWRWHCVYGKEETKSIWFMLFRKI